MRVSHKQRFENMRDDHVVRKSEQYAKYTLPYLMVDTQQVAYSDQQVPVERDYQELGPLLVNNLSAKLAAILFPVGRPFMQIELTGATLEKANERFEATELKSGLARMEMDATQQLFRNASYSQIIQGLKHLIVCGNVLMYRDSKRRRTLAYGLNQFTCRRDGNGDLLDCVLREYTFYTALPPDVRQALLNAHPAKYAGAEQGGPDVRVEKYTRIYREVLSEDRSIMHVSQELDDVPVGTPGKYADYLCPWQVVTWNLQTGEHYARSLVEDYAGGFAKLSDLSQAATLYGIEMTKIINLVSQAAGSSVDQLAKAGHGEWVQGDPNSVLAFESGAYQKLAALVEVIGSSWTQLSRAFMYTGNTRDAERVTAYELKQLALEAEYALGGVFSSLAESWQVGLGHLLVLEVNPGILEGIITKNVRLDIKSGISALGRSADVQALLQAAQEAAGAAPLAQLDTRISLPKLMDVIYAGQSIDTSVIFKSESELAQEAQAQQNMQGAQDAAATAAMSAELQQALSGTIQQGV